MSARSWSIASISVRNSRKVTGTLAARSSAKNEKNISFNLARSLLSDGAAGAEFTAHRSATALLALQGRPELVPAFVHGGDDETHRNADIGEDGFGQLQARFDRLGHRVVDAEFVELRRVACVACARDDREIRTLEARRGNHRL